MTNLLHTTTQISLNKIFKFTPRGVLAKLNKRKTRELHLKSGSSFLNDFVPGIRCVLGGEATLSLPSRGGMQTWWKSLQSLHRVEQV